MDIFVSVRFTATPVPPYGDIKKSGLSIAFLAEDGRHLYISNIDAMTQDKVRLLVMDYLYGFRDVRPLTLCYDDIRVLDILFDELDAPVPSDLQVRAINADLTYGKRMEYYERTGKPLEHALYAAHATAYADGFDVPEWP